MRKRYLLLAGAGVAVLAACSGDKKTSMNDDLKKDLELASSSDGITLANSSSNAGQQVISAIERTTPPARRPALRSLRPSNNRSLGRQAPTTRFPFLHVPSPSRFPIRAVRRLVVTMGA